MKLDDWRAGVHEPPRAPTPRGVQDRVVLSALAGDARKRHRRLAVLVLVLVAAALLQPSLSRDLARLAPPIAATGEFLMQTGDRWSGYEVFSVDQSSVILAAIADGRWPDASRAWPRARAFPVAPDLTAIGPDHTGAMMYYARPGLAGHSAWLASPGPDGVWSCGVTDPVEVAARIDLLARQFEGDLLAGLARGEPGGPWAYNVRWGDDHIVLFRIMLLARGRQDVVRARLREDPTAPRTMERLQLPALWADQAAEAGMLLTAIQAEDGTSAAALSRGPRPPVPGPPPL